MGHPGQQAIRAGRLILIQDTGNQHNWSGTEPIIRIIALLGFCSFVISCFPNYGLFREPWYAWMSEQEIIWLNQDSLNRGRYFTKFSKQRITVFVHAGALERDQIENKCAIIVSLEIYGENIKERLNFFPDSATFSMNGNHMIMTESSIIFWKDMPSASVTFHAVYDLSSCSCESSISLEQKDCISFDFRKTFMYDQKFLPITTLTGTFVKQ